MTPISSFSQLLSHLSSLAQRSRVAVVWGTDESTQEALLQGLQQGFIAIAFVGGCDEIAQNKAFLPYNEHIEYIEAADFDEASQRAVALVREGKADVLMKGLVNTDKLLHAILNKETGILPKGAILSHVTAAQIAHYPKLLFFSDPAVIPYPTLDQRRQLIQYVAQACRNFGIQQPRISLIHCTEKVNGKTFPVTLDYQTLREEAAAGQLGDVIVDGPLDLKTSICRESMQTKGIQSPIDGQADGLIFSDIQAANVFFKIITFFPETKVACCLQGTQCPVVLTSRSDNTETKFLSLALACL